MYQTLVLKLDSVCTSISYHSKRSTRKSSLIHHLEMLTSEATSSTTQNNKKANSPTKNKRKRTISTIEKIKPNNKQTLKKNHFNHDFHSILFCAIIYIYPFSSKLSEKLIFIKTCTPYFNMTHTYNFPESFIFYFDRMSV